ncbi:MAG TPA: ComF family protein [Povalibacter sp.]|uniref:ComF family protein n=1 Tax=Povalibacter sp. TaxID=1962978 RepID=UPI002B685D65|nr:ComF family protein [Povalibacter sp.]HMN44686.1 ComF family protein [Povalibacter sp.]
MVDVIRKLSRRIVRLAGEWNAATCVLCSARGASPALDLCADCRADLPVNDDACARCAEPLARRISRSPLICGACLRHPPRFDATLCALRYAYPVDQMVQRLKYGGAVAYGRVLGELLADRVRTRRAALPDCIVPMPLAQSRFRARGYNQAIEVAAVLERRLSVPVRTDLVERIRHTREQAELDRTQRRRNVRGAFALREKLPGQHIAIIDDVVTTGSTVNELARVLKRAGARRVDVWAVARAGRMK